MLNLKDCSFDGSRLGLPHFYAICQWRELAMPENRAHPSWERPSRSCDSRDPSMSGRPPNQCRNQVQGFGWLLGRLLEKRRESLVLFPCGTGNSALRTACQSDVGTWILF